MLRLLLLSVCCVACASTAPVTLATTTTTTTSAPAPTLTAPLAPISVDEAARFALAHNPQLRAVRAALGVRDAEVFAAGVWPDPDIDLGLVVPIAAAGEGLGVDGGIHWDFSTLWTQEREVAAAQLTADAARSEVDWQAGAVFADIRVQASRMANRKQAAAIAAAAVDSAAHLVDAAADATTAGEATLDALTLRQVALQDARARIAEIDRDRSEAQRRLCAGLGLDPRCGVDVQEPGPPPGPSTSLELSALLTRASQQRLDLRALRAAFGANEAAIQGAVLAQFPRIGLALQAGHDTGGFSFGGATVDVSLPIFDGGRGARALTLATRDQLQAEYDARLFDVQHVLADALALIDSARQERTLLQALVPILEHNEAALATALAAGDATSVAWAEVHAQLLDTHLRVLDVDQGEREAFIAIDAATGWGAASSLPSGPTAQGAPSPRAADSEGAP